MDTLVTRLEDEKRSIGEEINDPAQPVEEADKKCVIFIFLVSVNFIYLKSHNV